ncbi:MAG: hypothetical protein V1761_00685, partial [bacterium]
TTADAWSTIKLPLTGDFSKFDHITFTVQGVAGTQLLIKIDPSYEKWVDMTGEVQVIEYDLTAIPAEVLAGLEWVYMFPAAGNATDVAGNLVITATVFNYQRLTYTTADPVVDFDVNSGWFDDSGAMATITYEEGYTNVEYARLAAAGLGWSNIRSQIAGPFADFDYLILVIQGTEGKQVLLKIEGSVGQAEKWVTLDGTEQTVVFDLTALADGLLNNLTMVLIFPEGGVAEASGSFKVFDLYFSNTAPETVVFENAFDGKGHGIETNLYWQTNTAGTVYTISYEGSIMTVAAEKTADHAWSTIKMPMNGDFSVFATIVIEVTGPVGTQILFKIDPSYEKWVTCTGEAQTVTWNISGIPADVLENLTWIYAFPGAGNAGVLSASYTISSFKWYRAIDQYVTADPVVDFDVNAGWEDVYLEGYTIAYGENDEAIVDYDRTGGEWTTIRQYVSGNFSDFNYLVAVVKGTAGKQLIMKVEGTLGGKDTWINLTGADQIVVLDISTMTDAQLNALTMVLFFGEPMVATASGQFTIYECYFTNIAPTPLLNDFNGAGNNVDTNMYWETNSAAGMFTITYEGSVMTVVAVKAAGTQWSTIKLPVDGDFSVFDKITITLTGPVGTQILFKINPSYEKWVTCTGEEQIVVWDISGIPAATLEALEYVYAFPGAHTNEAFEGTFVVNSFKWSRPVLVYTTADPVVDFNVLPNFIDENLEGYDIAYDGVSGAMTVVYDRTGGAWSTIRSYVSGPLSDFHYLVLKVTGTATEQVLLKVEGTGVSKELWCTFTGGADTFVMDLSTLSAAQLDAILMVLLFPEGGVEPASGTIVVTDLYFSNVNPNAE